ncbi:E3 ubiquitin-protein ligase NRDP1-like [Teleopsis dalmanni]|uniref:E3 ubiquitin-protein ligase NRDP1-like n=1 Tax=Teleopsis dalmanni TaxID=139649 RepID=UPI0018CD579F|nr:E3 ubiquitin-protein ligase NRDP1-like [Teleopsis dalmanni]XP_037939048.1 E3 ubiquitin-protein ligase NRDP1-like [Teleopsis dalmanni]XP_037939674.1 E3 ubiquitin-protein ligase NRDP1-like [Teleopsis dalmanni]XP_037941100.1 E3 ubiquitin-protein ligase NRDP1-like [Teleopsis dalmanni]XP_037941106.1 E3 ubiquitin-protein ligase NRDP1-like [Teleopsis dalmanni]XP_037941114.1 E3 ubiquitin-protein ligase NRDP1-like [Teleopsis dalmanni]XP_037941125.1 E3 ubiquitin-protein ligase NRDP1-like [Teleopsis 
MGYEINRFVTFVDELLLCVICNDVLEDPVKCDACVADFCRACILKYLSDHSKCPECRHSLVKEDLTTSSRVVRNMLADLTISCENRIHGCETQLKFDSLQKHEDTCDKNPFRCRMGCGLLIKDDNHHCVSGLRQILEMQAQQIQNLQLDRAQLQFETKILVNKLNALTAIRLKLLQNSMFNPFFKVGILAASLFLYLNNFIKSFYLKIFS